MKSGRLEAFSDGVLAIIITVMLLELRIPEGDTFGELWSSSGQGLLTYALSFVYIGIYWNNHHHVLQVTDRVTGSVLWANLHLLFWLSMLPLATGWMETSGFARAPVMAYGIVLLLSATAFLLLQRAIARSEGPDSLMRQVVGRDVKGKVSLVFYLAGIALGAFIGDGVGIVRILAIACFVAVAVLWLIPDRRIEASALDRTAEEGI